MGLTFDQDNLRHCVQINISEDGVVEGPEKVNVTLTSADNVNLDPDTAIVEIEERGGKTREEVTITIILITFIIVPMLNGTLSPHSLHHAIRMYACSELTTLKNCRQKTSKSNAYISAQTHSATYCFLNVGFSQYLLLKHSKHSLYTLLR